MAKLAQHRCTGSSAHEAAAAVIHQHCTAPQQKQCVCLLPYRNLTAQYLGPSCNLEGPLHEPTLTQAGRATHAISNFWLKFSGHLHDLSGTSAAAPSAAVLASSPSAAKTALVSGTPASAPPAGVSGAWQGVVLPLWLPSESSAGMPLGQLRLPSWVSAEEARPAGVLWAHINAFTPC